MSPRQHAQDATQSAKQGSHKHNFISRVIGESKGGTWRTPQGFSANIIPGVSIMKNCRVCEINIWVGNEAISNSCLCQNALLVPDHNTITSSTNGFMSASNGLSSAE